MNWSFIYYLSAIILMVSGSILIKVSFRPVWSIRRRVLLRNGLKNSIKNNYSRWYWFTFYKKGSPFYIIIELVRKNRIHRMEREIFEAISFLRNIAAIGRGKTTSTDYIIQKLSENKGLLQPTYIKMLSLLRLNKEEEAIQLFSSNIKSTIGKEFARLLILWDKINPSELSETLLTYEKNIKEIRITNQKRRDEIISDLIYLPVVLNVFVIFINFIYVAYFIEQKEMLQIFI